MIQPSKSKGRRLSAGINAGSMADIAFLLLIFFLVTTQFNQEKVMKVKLPPWSDSKVAGPTSKAILNIKVNAVGEVLMDGEILPIEELKHRAHDFILKPITKSGKERAAGNGIISLQHDNKTAYGVYLKIYDEIQSAYRAIHQEKSIQLFQKSWEDIDVTERNQILEKFPIKISEAEPFSYAKN